MACTYVFPLHHNSHDYVCDYDYDRYVARGNQAVGATCMSWAFLRIYVKTVLKFKL